MNESLEGREYLDDDQRKIIDELRMCKKVESQVALMATIFDRKGADFVLSLIPILGDISASTLMAGFLLYQGNRVSLPKTSMTKIVLRQASDSMLGMIPYAGAVIDLVWSKSVVRSLAYFEKQTKMKIEEAKQKGISDEEIKNIVQDTQKVTQYLRFFLKNKAVRHTTRTALQKLFKKDVTK